MLSDTHSSPSCSQVQIKEALRFLPYAGHVLRTSRLLHVASRSQTEIPPEISTSLAQHCIASCPASGLSRCSVIATGGHSVLFSGYCFFFCWLLSPVIGFFLPQERLPGIPSSAVDCSLLYPLRVRIQELREGRQVKCHLSDSLPRTEFCTHLTGYPS